MEFCWVTLNVNDMKDSLKFYHDILGLEINSRFNAGEGIEIAMLGKADKPKVELICNEHHKIAERNTGISIGLEVESLDDIIKHLQNNGINIIRGPYSPNPYLRFCFIKDPSGIEVQLVENI